MKTFYILILFLSFAFPVHAAETVSPLEDVQIQGSSYDSKNPAESMVVLNGIVLRPGDNYRGYILTEVTAEHIILTDGEGQGYELSQTGDHANVQKKGIPLNTAVRTSGPTATEIKNWVDSKTQAVKNVTTAASDSVVKGNPLMKSYDRTKAQIDQIKADRDKRDVELNKLMDGMDPQPSTSPK